MDLPSKDRPMQDYQNRLARFKDTDAEKNQLISDLMDQLEASRKEHRQAAQDLHGEKVSRRSFQEQAEELEKLMRLRSDQSFVLVLIDADADDYIFAEKFLSNGEKGGQDAADELNRQVNEYVETLSIDDVSTKVMVRAYANVKGLQDACRSNGKMKNAASLDRFVHGFNRRQALFDFVDVGPWKEGADNKIRDVPECLDFYIDSSQCQHIIFGGCHDSGYAAFLGKFAANTENRDRITLLQGVAVHPDIASLGFQKIVRFDSVFALRSTIRRSVQGFTPWVAPSPAVPAGTAVVPNGSHGPPFVNPSSPSNRLGPILHNDAGQRVDKMLHIDTGSSFFGVLGREKLCSWYYLRGRCDFCNRKHSFPPLNAEQFDCLWYMTRAGVCYKTKDGKVCEDPLCVYRHEKGCQIGSGHG